MNSKSLNYANVTNVNFSFHNSKINIGVNDFDRKKWNKALLNWIISLFTSLKWKQISLIKWILTALASYISTYRVCTWGILTAMLLYLSSEESKNSNCWNDLNSLRSQGFLVFQKEGKIWIKWIQYKFQSWNTID